MTDDELRARLTDMERRINGIRQWTLDRLDERGGTIIELRRDIAMLVDQLREVQAHFDDGGMIHALQNAQYVLAAKADAPPDGTERAS